MTQEFNAQMRRTRWLRFIKQRLVWIPLAVLTVWTVAPVVLAVSVSLKKHVEVFASPSLIPQDPSLTAYGTVLSSPSFQQAFINSVVIGLGSCAITLILGVPAAYAFARFRFPGQQLVLLFLLLPRLVPSLGLMVPLYRLAVALGALDSRLTLMVVYAGVLLPLAVWLLVGFFQQIPREIEEAASVDGATTWRRLRHVVLPLSFPALITIGILAFREAWDEFTLVLVLTTSPDARTLPYELYRLSSPGGDQQNIPAEAAFALLTILPLLFAYKRFEKYVTEGLTSGAVK